ncbi:hypothetical protein K1T71_012530 [Dendrolimus kikuchii]|uniref:Uncharacterized protein n=1 Tax=Dendrolimus kikuchii TaxID=765133 RepID=A0ACC1CJL6_9NEOP|nr:hypothetical protein K1T71_012530 [Dendrolimus kikuchii]
MYTLLWFTLFGFAVSSPTLKDDQDEHLKIVGGENIEITEAPYQVSIQYRGRHTCGGAIVDTNIIVTAAHCIFGTQAFNYQVRAGSSFSQRDGLMSLVSDMIWHPGFNYATMDNDVAILWLATPLTFNGVVAPIEMFQAGEEVTDGDITVVTGWGHISEGGGYPTMLQRVLVPKVNEAVCDFAYQPMYRITPRMLCAGTPAGGKDACQGDSGGPLIYNGKLAGIVSWGLGCARPDYPGVYAKVSSLRGWLDLNIAMMKQRHVLRN